MTRWSWNRALWKAVGGWIKQSYLDLASFHWPFQAYKMCKYIRWVGVSVGRSFSQEANQSIHPSVYQSISQSVSQSVIQWVGDPVSHWAGHYVNHFVSQWAHMTKSDSVSQSVSQPATQSAHQYANPCHEAVRQWAILLVCWSMGQSVDINSWCLPFVVSVNGNYQITLRLTTECHQSKRTRLIAVYNNNNYCCCCCCYYYYHHYCVV